MIRFVKKLWVGLVGLCNVRLLLGCDCRLLLGMGVVFV